MSEKTLKNLFDLESQESGGVVPPPSSISGDNKQLPIQDWLPITESRKGNIYTATFHLLCSGIGFQLILIPAAFAALGWTWGIISLTVGFVWKLYTIWLLVNLHESVQGTRFSRYLLLAMASFGVKRGKLLGIFPLMYLSGGACSILVITGGKSIQQLQTILSTDNTEPLTSVQCFLIFSCIAVLLSQFPNLSSLYGVSLIGSVMAITYCTVIWVLPVTSTQEKFNKSVSYATTDTSFSNIFNAIGLIALSFRGSNLVLEIQGTLPSNSKRPSSKTMWRAVVISHVIIAMLMFPLSIVVYWAYGDKIPVGGGPISNYLKLYGQDYSKRATSFIHLTFIFSCLCSYPINLMPACDNAEFIYITKKQKPCSFFVRAMLRVFLSGICFFIAVTFPFLPYLSVLIGSISLVVTFTYPSFMWISIKQPRRSSLMWWLNMLIGCLGASLSVLLLVAAALRLDQKGLKANFFKP